jgi:holo-[acyl-carrier protein] synthase
MIKGIGTDIVEVKRIQTKFERSAHFKTHVFSEDEIQYCDRQPNPAMHFAARWAAKEAYLKAFGVRFIGNHVLSEIETKHEENGKPYIALSGKELESFHSKLFKTIHLSISHTEQYATAYIIIED